MTDETAYFAQFSGEEGGAYCEYCGAFIPEGTYHWVRFSGTKYITCDINIENEWNRKWLMHQIIMLPDNAK